MKKEITTLQELNELGGLAFTRSEIANIIECAKYENNFYIGTDMASWLNNFEILDEEDMIETFSIAYEEGSHLTHEFELITHDNSYNWGGNSSRDIDFKIIQSLVTDSVYAYIRVHTGGDIRGGYTSGLLIDLESYSEDAGAFMFDNVNEHCNGSYLQYNGDEYSVNGSITSEYLSVYNHSNDTDYEICAFVYEFDEESYKKEVIEIIKEAVEGGN